MGASLYSQQRMLADALKRVSVSDDELQDLRQQGKICEDEIVEARKRLEEAKGIQMQKHDVLEQLGSEQTQLKDQISRMSRFNEETSSEALVNQRTALKTDELLGSMEREKEAQDREIVWLEEQIQRTKKEVYRIDNRAKSAQEEHSNMTELVKDAKSLLERELRDRNRVVEDINTVQRALMRRNHAISESMRAVQNNALSLREEEVEEVHVRKRLKEEQARFDRLIGEWFQRTEIARTWLLNKLDSDSKIKNGVIVKLCQIKESIKAANVHCEEARKELRREQREEESILRDIFLTRSKLESLRESSFSEIGGKNAANAAFSDVVKEYQALSKYEKGKETELNRILEEVKRVVPLRESTEARAQEVEEKISVAESRVSQEETALTVVSNQNIKLERQLESRTRKLEQLRMRITVKAERIREAELSQMSSEVSLTLIGKVKKFENDIKSSLDECGNYEKLWLRQQEEILHEQSERDSESTYLRKTKAVLLILENKRKRKLSEMNEWQIEIKRKKNEVLKLKLDLDKLGSLISRFDDKIALVSDLAVSVEESSHDSTGTNRISQVEELNQHLRNEIAALTCSLEQSEKDRLTLEKKVEVEEQVQSSLVDEPDSMKEIEKTINRMRTELNELSKRKELLSRSIVQMIEKRDSIEIKHIGSRSRKSLSKGVALSSCSTTVSLSSLQTDSYRDRLEILGQEVSQVDQKLISICDQRKVTDEKIQSITQANCLLEHATKILSLDLVACTLRLDAVQSMHGSITTLLGPRKIEKSNLALKEKRLLQRELNCWNEAIRGILNPEWNPIKKEMGSWIAFCLNLLNLD